MKKLRAVLIMMVAALLLTACLHKAADIAENAGIGRDTPGETTEDASSPDTETAESEETAAETEGETPPADGKNWAFVNGKYEYYFAERDKTAQLDLSDMAGVPNEPFADQPNDWYGGKVTYDEATGQVTYGWDRYDSTIKVLDQYGGIYRGDTESKVLYLTFDCGYEYGLTGDLLDILKEKNVPAIFFVTGQYVKEETELIGRMLDEGHLVGNHTVRHKRATTLSAQDFVNELQELEDMFLTSFPDADPMLYYRPPYGNCNEYTLRLADKMGLRTVMWSFTYQDYDVNNQPTYEEAMAKVKTGLHPGAVYLFHTESTANVSIMGDFIDWARGQGYEFLPICDVK